MLINPNASRRVFLRHAGALGALLGPAAAPDGAEPFGASMNGGGGAERRATTRRWCASSSSAATTPINMVLPTDTAPSWAKLPGDCATRRPIRSRCWRRAPPPNAGRPRRLAGAAGRRAADHALITPGGRRAARFALHPCWAALRTLFDTDRRLAIVPNVGPLVMPTTKAQYAWPRTPSRRACSRTTTSRTPGRRWRPKAPRAAGAGAWATCWRHEQRSARLHRGLGGRQRRVAGRPDVQQYQVGSNGAIRMGSDANGPVYGSAAVAQAMQRIVSRHRRGGHVFEADLAASRSARSTPSWRCAARCARQRRAFGTRAGQRQLQRQQRPQAAVRQPAHRHHRGQPAGAATADRGAHDRGGGQRGIGARRQVFFVSLGGFDSHDLQNRNHADLMARLGHAWPTSTPRSARWACATASPPSPPATSAALSRAMATAPTTAGAAHHFVMGGAVRGGDLYGTFPVLGPKNANNNNFDASPDQLGNGALLPTTSVDQFGATLARWFGAADTDLGTVFPNLGNFSGRNLGFMV
jgi:uncharacterized protein (DUF1501 family)